MLKLDNSTSHLINEGSSPETISDFFTVTWLVSNKARTRTHISFLTTNFIFCPLNQHTLTKHLSSLNVML